MDGDGYVLPTEQRPAHQEALGCPKQSLTWQKSPQSGFLPQNIKPGYLKLQLRVRNEVREEKLVVITPTEQIQTSLGSFPGCNAVT